MKGSKVVRVSRPAKNVDKRQATLQLTFCAEQSENMKPGICFGGVPSEKNGEVNPKHPKSAKLKGEKYAKGVNVYFQRNAYFDHAHAVLMHKIRRVMSMIIWMKVNDVHLMSFTSLK